MRLPILARVNKEIFGITNKRGGGGGGVQISIGWVEQKIKNQE